MPLRWILHQHGEAGREWMRAVLLLRERRQLEEAVFVEARIWQVPQPVRGSSHSFKYALALVSDGRCVLRYDNEAGKGDHRHIDGREEPYLFRTTDELVDDFMGEVASWLKQGER